MDPKYRGTPYPQQPVIRQAKRVAIQAQLDAYLEAGYIRKRGDKEPIYGTVVLKAVYKDGGKMRLVMDATALNKCFVPPPLRLPTILEPWVNSPTWFAKIDLREAFMHLPLSEEF